MPKNVLPLAFLCCGSLPALGQYAGGVAEARNAQGELFGFDRTQAISTEPAEKIARAAQQFGQEDDITVLTLKRMVPA